MDQLRRYAIFAAVVEAGSMTGAAKALGMTPSAVSQHISQLESQLGLPLLHRSTRRLGQAEAAGGAMEQGEAEQALQLAYMLADRGGSHAEGLGGPRHGARLHHGGEDGVTSELIHY